MAHQDVRRYAADLYIHVFVGHLAVEVVEVDVHSLRVRSLALGDEWFNFRLTLGEPHELLLVLFKHLLWVILRGEVIGERCYSNVLALGVLTNSFPQI